MCTASKNEKDIVLTRVTERLELREDIVFAFVHGSFVTEDRFNDIDIAVFLSRISSAQLLLELDFETKLGLAVPGVPWIINTASSAQSFKYVSISPLFIASIAVFQLSGRCP